MYSTAKNITSKSVAIVLSLLMIFSVVSLNTISTSAQTTNSASNSIIASGNCGGPGPIDTVTWSLDSDGTLMIMGLGAVRNGWQGYESQIKNVIFLGHYARILADTFNGCTSLESIAIPDGVVEIGSHAFANCTSLKTVYIPSSVTTIGDGAFENCPSLIQNHKEKISFDA